MLWVELSARSGLPRRLLQKLWTSEDFTELIAFKRLYTLDPDLWAASAQLGRCVVSQEYPAEGFAPVKRRDEDEQRARRLREIDELDLEAEDY